MIEELSEKLTETLFDIYFHRMFALGEITFFAPSIQREKDCAYDGRFVGNRAKHELLLQFKQPKYLTRGKYFRFKIDGCQLKTLHDAIKKTPSIRNHIFYAAPAYIDIAELNKQQQVSHDPCCFLNFYILIRAASLPKDTAYVFFRRDLYSEGRCTYCAPRNPSYKTNRSTQPYEIKFSRSLKPSDWLTVCDGIHRFKNKVIGAPIMPAQNSSEARYALDDSFYSVPPSEYRGALLQLTDAFIEEKSGRPLIIRLNEEG